METLTTKVLGRKVHPHALRRTAPARAGSHRHLYVPRDNLAAVVQRAHADLSPEHANLHFHVVDDDYWPFVDGDAHTSLLVAWLDLADEDDRAANLLYDRLAKR